MTTFQEARNLVEIFPEAKPYLQDKLKEYKEAVVAGKKRLKKNLRSISKKYSGFDQWFFTYLNEVFLGEDLEIWNQKKNKIEWMLAKKVKPAGEITESVVERAKNYPIKDILGVKEDMICCPYHKEKTPSCYLKNNYLHCFGCGKTADTIQLVMDMTGIGFQEAVRKLQ